MTCLIITLSILVLQNLVPSIQSLRCYECGVSEGSKDAQITSCSHFKVDDPKFRTECEAGSKSCRLARKVNENVVLSRSCETMGLNDCKVANSIEFCYCTKDFCNDVNLLEDDDGNDEALEDIEDGSGVVKNSIDIIESDEISVYVTVSSATILNNSITKPTNSIDKISSSCSKNRFDRPLISIFILLYFGGHDLHLHIYS